MLFSRETREINESNEKMLDICECKRVRKTWEKQIYLKFQDLNVEASVLGMGKVERIKCLSHVFRMKNHFISKLVMIKTVGGKGRKEGPRER